MTRVRDSRYVVTRIEAAASRLAAALLLIEKEAIADARPCPACGRWMENAASPQILHEEGCELETALREAGLRGG